MMPQTMEESNPPICFSTVGEMAAFRPPNFRIFGLVGESGSLYEWVPDDATAASHNSVPQSNPGGVPGRWIRKTPGGTVGVSDVFNVVDYGAEGNGNADDTASVAAAVSALNANGGGVLYFPATTQFYRVSATTTLGSRTWVVAHGSIHQITASTPIFAAVNQADIDVQAVAQGQGGVAAVTNACLIRVVSCDRVTVHDCTLSAFADVAVIAFGGTKLTVRSCAVTGSLGLVRASGVNGVHIEGNEVRSPHTPAATFIIPIFIDSTDGHTFGYCTDVEIVGNLVKDYPNAQSVEVHAGERIAIVGNNFDNVLNGVNINPLGFVYTTLTAQFVQPAVNANVTAQVASTALITTGQQVYVDTGGFYTAVVVDGTHLTLTNLGKDENAAPGAVVINGSNVLAGDLCKGISIVGNNYLGTTTAGGAANGNNGILVAGDPSTNKVHDVTIVGNTIRNANFIAQGSAGGIYLNNLDTVAISDNAIELCYTSGLTIEGKVTNLSGNVGTIKNVLLSTFGRRVGIEVTGQNNTGRIVGVTVDGAVDGLDFALVNLGLAVDGGKYLNLTGIRVINPANAIVDGVLYKVDGDTAPDVSNGVRVVRCADTGATVVANPGANAYAGQELTYFGTNANTTIDRSNAALQGSANWVSANKQTIRLIKSTTDWLEECRSVANG